MKFVVLKNNFQKGLNVISKAVNPRVALPILSNILIQTEEGRLRLTASDLQITISSLIGAKVEEEGEITIPSKVLLDFIGQAVDEKLEVSLDGAILEIKSDHSDAKFAGVPSGEFPKIETSNSKVAFSIDSKELLEAINKVAFCAALDESRPVFTGIYLSVHKQELVMAATDGYRMAEYRLLVNYKGDEPVSCVLPARHLAETIRSFAPTSKVVDFKIDSEANSVEISVEDMKAQIRMIDGEYPEYKAIVPDEFSTSVSISRSALLNSVKLANVFAKDMGNMIKLFIEENKIVCKSKPSEAGSNVVDVEAELDGDEMEIAFNAKYLIDFLGNISEEEIVFRANEPLKPGLFNIKDKKNYFFLAMPMKADW